MTVWNKGLELHALIESIGTSRELSLAQTREVPLLAESLVRFLAKHRASASAGGG